jgi:hypothetical protein
MCAQTCSPPPLHLIIGKDYCKLGDLPAAQRHHNRGRQPPWPSATMATAG